LVLLGWLLVVAQEWEIVGEENPQQQYKYLTLRE
jgi:hypothetical protein